MQVKCESCKSKYEESFDYEHIADYALMMCNKCVGCESYEEVENLIRKSVKGLY